uniref:Uncharacterized protein n=1 Tax=Amphimedon queenslandica TaxID=400682 RepID=A0A1X7U3H9_AMPQE
LVSVRCQGRLLDLLLLGATAFSLMLLDLNCLNGSWSSGAKPIDFRRRECFVSSEIAVAFKSTCTTITKEP